MKISQITRRDIVDAIAVEKINWSGRLEESEFLSRLFNLAAIESYDGRFDDVAGDIWQHRVNNDDWGDDWVFSDARFNLMNGDDETFLARSYWIPGSYVTSNAMSAPSSALPRFRTLCTHSKKPR
jgi:hypothetical protein